MNIGELIRKHRESQKLSMNDLSRLSGVAQSNISYIENGQRQPTFDVLKRLINAMGYTLAEFFAEDAPDMPPEIRRLMDQAKTLSPEQVEILTEFIRKMKGE